MVVTCRLEAQTAEQAVAMIHRSQGLPDQSCLNAHRLAWLV